MVKNWEEIRQYHLECATHTNQMGNISESEKHVKASYLASIVKKSSLAERSYNTHVEVNKIKKYV